MLINSCQAEIGQIYPVVIIFNASGTFIIISLSAGFLDVLTARTYFRPTQPIQPEIYRNPKPGRINSAAWLQRPSAIRWGKPSVPHSNSERLYLSNRAFVLSICCSKAKAGGVPTSYFAFRCSSFFYARIQTFCESSRITTFC